MSWEMNNNADYGISFQYVICKKYNIEIHKDAINQFNANFNQEYESKIIDVLPSIFDAVGSKPIKLLTYTKEVINGKLTTSPHNFLLENGKTLSIRTNKKQGKVAPKTIGQAGYRVLNDYFADVYGKPIENQDDIKKMIYDNIDVVLPVFIDKLFQSDYTVFVNMAEIEKIILINASDVGMYSFTRGQFSFSRELPEWKESTTLKYNDKSIAEIQVHKERTFKFRFIVDKIPEWFEQVKITNETLGVSAEYTICEIYNLDKPKNFTKRVLMDYVKNLTPIIKEAFVIIPDAIRYTGEESGGRGKQSKCSYDFVLKEEKTLSLKSNLGKMVCPPEVGQPGSDTCLLYFKEFLKEGIVKVSREDFKEMVLNRIEEIMPIYVDHLFDSDWLLWVYEKNGVFEQQSINKADINEIQWEKARFSFTKPTLEEWNESNTVKYDGVSIGEFQVHQNRNCFKFRFNMPNLLKIILRKEKG